MLKQKLMSLQKNKRRITMKLENIDFNGKSYNLRIDRYASSNFIAILMGEPNDEWPDVITTNNSVMEKDENDDTEYVQIRTDEKQYAQLLIENGLIEERPDMKTLVNAFVNFNKGITVDEEVIKNAKKLIEE